MGHPRETARSGNQYKPTGLLDEGLSVQISNDVSWFLSPSEFRISTWLNNTWWRGGIFGLHTRSSLPMHKSPCRVGRLVGVISRVRYNVRPGGWAVGIVGSLTRKSSFSIHKSLYGVGRLVGVISRVRYNVRPGGWAVGIVGSQTRKRHRQVWGRIYI